MRTTAGGRGRAAHLGARLELGHPRGHAHLDSHARFADPDIQVEFIYRSGHLVAYTVQYLVHRGGCSVLHADPQVAQCESLHVSKSEVLAAIAGSSSLLAAPIRMSRSKSSTGADISSFFQQVRSVVLHIG
ncbi:hypothetical protein GCM10009764_55460 [Nocardia ninae]|uniref:Uncharacterized protein n=1 Tax=Nocardia ninae NBRC 108245 TaxID=1210091 RepID=A0A511M5A1_9NOCA|nr:hypothetical protein NN4_03210 [Nocardia ninae NBRC 108245]